MPADHDDSQDPIPSELAQDDAYFAERVQAFLNGLQGRVAELQRALDVQDFVALRALARQLNGSADALGYSNLTRQATQLEKDALDEAVAAVEHDLQVLQRLVARVVLRA